ncbi:MAG: efflux RND transporter periplasmic adaptor subunit [Pseudomonadota bacterium]
MSSLISDSHGGRLTLAAVFTLFAFGCSEAPAPELPPVPVKVVAIEVRDIPVYKEYVGELVPAQEVALRARTSGILMHKHVPDGALVEEGQLLFTIDDRDATQRREAARAELAAAQAQLARARADVDRYEPLLAEEAIARQVYDNAVAAYEAAEAGVKAQRALLKQAELTIEYSTVVSPLSGRMGAAEVAEGDLISAGSTVLATVAVDDPLWVYFSPSENELLEFEKRRREQPTLMARLSQDARLLLGDGEMYGEPGEINFADRALDPVTGTYRLRVEFPNPESRLLPGQFTRVRLQSNLFENAIVVPARAVLQVLDQSFVGVVGTDQTVEHRPVVLGPRIDGDWIISEGLEAGETIVVDGIQKARPGARVTPKPADAPGAAGT